MRTKILVITGPTATGKTDLAIELAKKFNGELISCDSRQVYKELDIGTGKLPGGEVANEKFDGYWIIDGVKIHLYDVASPFQQYNVSQYVKDSKKIINQIQQLDKLPIIVGGTGLYLKALLENFSDISMPVDLVLRKKLEKLSLEKLQQKLESLSPSVFEDLNNSEKNNTRRLVRHIEKLSVPTETPIIVKKDSDTDILKIGLTTKRTILNQKIDQRVDKRIKNGMIEEVESLHQNGLSFKRMKELGLEYRILAEYLEGSLSKGQLSEKLKLKIHQYAKRQMTWFKMDSQIKWFDIEDKNLKSKVVKIASNWYNTTNDQTS